jgi:hypothetical protein
MFEGKYIFSQIAEFLPRRTFSEKTLRRKILPSCFMRRDAQNGSHSFCRLEAQYSICKGVE